MNILVISGFVNRDASAAILVDGRLIAAAEAERFIRDEHLPALAGHGRRAGSEVALRL